MSPGSVRVKRLKGGIQRENTTTLPGYSLEGPWVSVREGDSVCQRDGLASFVTAMTTAVRPAPMPTSRRMPPVLEKNAPSPPAVAAPAIAPAALAATLRPVMIPPAASATTGVTPTILSDSSTISTT